MISPNGRRWQNIATGDFEVVLKRLGRQESVESSSRGAIRDEMGMLDSRGRMAQPPNIDQVELVHDVFEVNLPRIIQPGFSCDSQERRVFTVRTNSGVSSTIPRSAIQSALCSQLQPLLDGNTRQSHPQGDWCIDPDPAAPHYADLMRLLNPGSIYLPIPGTSESTIVKVDNSFRLSPLMPLKLLFRQIPIECSGIGFPEAVLEHAGYRVVASSDRPLQAPPSGSVHIIKYWAGTDKESRHPDDSIICINVLPPVDDPHLRHLPPRLILGGGRQDIFTSVERDPLPHVPRHLLARDAPDAAFLPDHLDFGAFRREPEDMDGVETAAEQRAATPPDPAPAAAPPPPERPVAKSSAQSASGAQAAETLADQQQLTEDGDGEVFRLPMPPTHLFRVTHGAPFIDSVPNPAPPPAVAAAAAFMQASDPSSLPETATAARVSTTLFPQPGPAPPGGRSGLRPSTRPPPPPQQQQAAFPPPSPPPPQQQTAPSLSPPPPPQLQLNHMPHPHPFPPFATQPPLFGPRRSAPTTADRSSNKAPPCQEVTQVLVHVRELLSKRDIGRALVNRLLPITIPGDCTTRVASHDSAIGTI